MKFALVVVLGLVAGQAFGQSGPPFALSPTQVWVEDGDTIDLSFRSEDTRLTMWNAPEISGAKCSQERNLGYAAKNRMIQLRYGGNLTFFFEDHTANGYVPWPSLSNPPKDCGYGRSCGSLYSNGVNVGEILAAEGLAKFYCVDGVCDVAAAEDWCP